MRQSPARSTTLARLRRNIIILGGVFAFIVLAGSVATGFKTRANALDQAERNAQNLVAALQEHASGAFQAADVALADVVFDAEKLGTAHAVQGPAWRRELKAKDEMLPQVRNIALIDASGQVLAESLDPGTSTSVASRPYFTFHRDNPSREFHIGTPIRSMRTGNWIIPVSRRIDKPDGSFDGVAVAIIDPAYFSDFYRSLDIGEGGTVWIFDRDRDLLIREPLMSELYDQSYKAKTIGEALDKAPSGTFIAPSPIDDVKRIISYRSVSDVPIIVAIGIRLDVAMASWTRDMRYRTMVVTAILVLITALVYALVRNLAAAQRAQDAQARLYEAIEGLSEAIVLYDAEERFVLCNSRHRELHSETDHLNQTGSRFEDILRYSVTVGQVTLAEGEGAEDFIVARLRQFRAPGREPIALQHVQNRWHQLSERRTPDGGVIRITTDITEMKEQQDLMARARDAAEASSRTKSLFLANMSHELRTPLHAILGLSEIIRDQSDAGGPVPEYGKMIHDSGQHLLTLINDILDMSKIEAGRFELVEETLSLPELAQACWSVVAPRADAAHVRFEKHLPADLPRLRVDARALKQILINLLSNAVKFTPEDGRVTLSAVREPEGDVALSVADTGVGIPADQIARVTEPFWQADPSHARKYGGTGLGLSITKHLVALHGGTMTVESTVGKGTTVIVRLPKERVVEAVGKPPAAV